jgi:hypothetical protein
MELLHLQSTENNDQVVQARKATQATVESREGIATQIRTVIFAKGRGEIGGAIWTVRAIWDELGGITPTVSVP